MSRSRWIVALLFTLGIGGLPPSLVAQKYAPIVGGWRVQLDLGGAKQTLAFETGGEGVYGRGAGLFRIDYPDGASRTFPAVWTNTNPQRIGITSELVLTVGGRDEAGTLVMRLTLEPGKGFSGDAVFLDSALAAHRGTFVMERTLSPEDLLSGHPNPAP